ncbi:MAG: hypothetical protein LBC98_07965 [Prevotellaceae bacterium]|jgi:hypothetical protein|nr:hypothetical protein [Prevotellaceae bacterium]
MKYLQFFIILSLFAMASCSKDKTRSNQSITFNPLQPRNLSEQSFELQATASSGLQVSFVSSNTSTASINGKIVTLLGAGTVYITASQSGNETYFEAPAVKQSLVINDDSNPNKANQTITFDLSVAEWKSSQGDLTLEATASSGLPVSFYSTHPNVLIIDNSLILTYTGEHYNDETTIFASQAGNAEYNAAPTVSRTLRVEHDEEN